ncbi:hypothetical protein [Tropicibacter naphthalenivorans]|uniref:Uncharacterized protein n=1 Tax=Tropicibacter naphthalenivorans TaxID=441103 RepID=A0A0P1GVV3_9RHOB|nr:hypothetical protein [Tropicibacter naphthalenivorans]CUH79940.1 hypothetical protein TRN7648_02724 [Tropicibacter naphthalenivorans]SMC76275.1 hypothetical protein SAMN04488093_103354 [Tropicibacter naphthalenivorans]
MPDYKTQIGDVSYNAADECFEALVTFHTDHGPRRVAASYCAPLTASFERVSAGIWNAALDRLDRPEAMQSRMMGHDATLPQAA